MLWSRLVSNEAWTVCDFWLRCRLQECNEGKWKEAAETAASAPSDVLRTQATITRLQAAPAVPGQKSPVLAYFGALLAKGGLNAVESVEMSRIAISQNKPELVNNWMTQGKLTASEPLGDLLKEVRRAAFSCCCSSSLTVVASNCSSVGENSEGILEWGFKSTLLLLIRACVSTVDSTWV